jgi:hypothetical protein
MKDFFKEILRIKPVEDFLEDLEKGPQLKRALGALGSNILRLRSNNRSRDICYNWASSSELRRSCGSYILYNSRVRLRICRVSLC